GVIRVRRRQVRRGGRERGEQVILARAAPAQGVVHGEVVGEIVFDDRGEHVDLHVVVVLPGAVEVVRVNRSGVGQERPRRIGTGVAGQADGGDAAIGHVVVLHVQVVEIDPGG